MVDEKHRNITVTDEGWEKVEQLLGIGNIADPENWDLKHHVEIAIKAHALYRRDVEYVVKDGEVIIVDEFTGRMMPGRRWSDGLHQAVEAKEGVKIERENQTLATITFQNYFRMYKKLAGMTGTAETEAAEFDKIYKLEVMVIPTNKQMLRIENPDVVYRTEKEKYFAAADEIQKLHATGQPVLVGTTSIEKSERLSELLKKKGVKHVGAERQAAREAKPRSLPRQDARARSRSPPTWRAAVPTFCSAATQNSWPSRRTLKKGIAQPVRVAEGKIEGADRRRQDHGLVLQRQRIYRSHRQVGGSLQPLQSSRPTRSMTKLHLPAACISLAPSVTNPAASTISFADAPAARAIRVPLASTFPLKMT